MTGFERRGGGTSFLVRLWREPRGEGAADGPARVYVRHLRSGEERYLKSIDDLTEFLARHHPIQPAAAAGDRGDAADNHRHAG